MEAAGGRFPGAQGFPVVRFSCHVSPLRRGGHLNESERAAKSIDPYPHLWQCTWHADRRYARPKGAQALPSGEDMKVCLTPAERRLPGFPPVDLPVKEGCTEEGDTPEQRAPKVGAAGTYKDAMDEVQVCPTSQLRRCSCTAACVYRCVPMRADACHMH